MKIRKQEKKVERRKQGSKKIFGVKWQITLGST